MAQGITNVLYDALKAHFEAKKLRAIATLTVYMTNPVGIGEHPQIIDEMVLLTKELEEAEGCLQQLAKTFEVSSPTNSSYA
jgi:hypothetical protein